MRWFHLPLAILAAFSTAGCGEGPDRAAADPERAPDVRLPVVEEVEEYPEPATRLVVNRSSTGAISVEGRALDLGALTTLLSSRASGLRAPDGLGESRLDVVLRVDRAAAWGDARPLLQACADPDIRIWRTCFAAVDGSGREGVVPAFLPREIHGTFPNPVRLELDVKGEGFPPAELAARMAKVKARTPPQLFEVNLDAHVSVPMGTFVEVLATLHRFEPEEITFAGPVDPPPPVAGPVTPRLRFPDPGGSRYSIAGRYPSIRRGLGYLHGRQLPTGSFWAGGRKGSRHEVGVTGLALLAFLGAGETHKHGSFRATVKRGLRYLKQVQDPEGCIGPREGDRWIYGHALGALAMCEAYHLTRSPLFKQSAQRAVEFIQSCRNPGAAWRYGVRPGDNDTSVTAWMVLALASAKAAGLRVEEEAFAGARAFVESVTDPTTGRVGYSRPGEPPWRPRARAAAWPAERTESTTAMGILVRLLAGESPESDVVRRGAWLLLRSPPAWDQRAGTIDPSYWLFGTLALSRVGGEDWDRWSEALRKALDRGSSTKPGHPPWRSGGVWGAEGGASYAPAVFVLLEEMLRGSPTVVGGWE
jgi:hypothetical protein